MPNVKMKNTFFLIFFYWQKESNVEKVFTMQIGSVSARRQTSTFYQILLNIPYA